MRSTAFGAFSAVALASLLSVTLHACANGSTDNPPPADGGGVHEGGEAGIDTSTGCGATNEPCCAESTCHSGFFCNMGFCKPQNPGDIGKPCTMPSDCQSGLCVVLGTDSGVPPPSPNVCSTGCATSMQCTPGWTCVQQGVLVGQGVCTCTPQTEQCDNLDDNCDGKVDEEPGADEACTAMDMVPEKCVAGSCVCVDAASMCNGTCTDLTSDSSNCGKCGVVCNTPVQACNASKCECAATMCGTKCIDTTSDPLNCGGCNMPCAYECTNSQCGPTLLATGTGGGGGGAGIASDGTNVYWFTGMFGAPFTLQSCAAAGCMSIPTSIAMNINPAAGLGFFGSGPNLLVTGGTNLFWPDGSNVQRSPFMTPAASSFHSGTAVNQPWQVATDASFVYWADTGAAMIYKCALGSTCATPTLVVNLTGIPLPPPDGGTPEGGMPEGGSEAGPAEAGVDGGMFVGFQPPELIAVDSKYIYWTDQSGDINSQLLAGGPPVTIVDNLDNPNFPPLPTAILANNGILYWVAGQFGGNGINACPANASCTANPGIYNMDFSAVAMATDGTDLYWTDSSPAAVKKCTLGLTCASPTTIVTQPTPASPGDITVDAKHTYWLDSASGGVYEFSK